MKKSIKEFVDIFKQLNIKRSELLNRVVKGENYYEEMDALETKYRDTKKGFMALLGECVPDEVHDEVHDFILSQGDGVVECPKGVTSIFIVDSTYSTIMRTYYNICAVVYNKRQYFINAPTVTISQIGEICT